MKKKPNRIQGRKGKKSNSGLFIISCLGKKGTRDQKGETVPSRGVSQRQKLARRSYVGVTQGP